MSKIHKYLIVALLAQAFAPLAQAQISESYRTYGAGLGLQASRTWSSRGVTSDSISAQSSLLFLNHHFHFGPALSYLRTYNGYSQSTGWGLGALGKWTYEDLQTTDRTPFITLSGYLDNTDGTGYIASDMKVDAGLGYETFFNQNVSLAQSINWTKTWYKFEETDDYLTDDIVSNDAMVSLRLGLNFYF